MMIGAFAVATLHAAETPKPAQAVPAQSQKQGGKPATALSPNQAVKAPEQAGPPSVPKAPTQLTAASPAGTKVILAWKDQSSNEQGFEIERRSGSEPFKNISYAIANVVTVDDRTVSPGNTYTYRIRAYNTAGVSAYSNEASATVTMPASAIQCPPLSGTLSCKVPEKSVPQGWKTTDYGLNVTYTFNQATVFQGDLMCTYNVPAGTVSIFKPVPAGKTCKDVDRKYFECN